MTTVLDHDAYTIAWIAVLPIEAEVAVGMLDRHHSGQFSSSRNDDYIYIGGEINRHNVVIATLPEGQTCGTESASALVNQVKIRFPNIWFALLVGIAAGLPNLLSNNSSTHRDIRLGDVLVCLPSESSAGIVHYDRIKDTEDGYSLYGRQSETPAIIRSAVGNIKLTKRRPFKIGHEFATILAEFQAKSENSDFSCPSQNADMLYANNDSGTRKLRVVPVDRHPRDESERTIVWYGNIGSGGVLMKNARRRDELRDKYDLIGLEMEAAGIMNTLPTGVIRGVCDYADSHKNDIWQPYAAAVAGTYAKGILRTIHPRTSPIDSRSKDALIKGFPHHTPEAARSELLVIYEPETGETNIDIVLIHGILGCPEKNWSSNKASEDFQSSSVDVEAPLDSQTPIQPPGKRRKIAGRITEASMFWPRDLLPKAFPASRIMTWPHKMLMEDFFGLDTGAEALLYSISKFRANLTNPHRPLVFIAHELGGLIAKNACLLSMCGPMIFKDVLPNKTGVIFFGTRHWQVGKILLGKEINSLGDPRIPDSNSREFGRFVTLGIIKAHSFQEGIDTSNNSSPVQVGYLFATKDRLSAKIEDMMDFSSKTDIKFCSLVAVLARWIEDWDALRGGGGDISGLGRHEPLPDALIFDKEYVYCLLSLQNSEAHNRYHDVEPAYQETYKWLFAQDVGFKPWLEGLDRSSIYWIQGKPGSGKSTIMKFAMMNDLLNDCLHKFSDQSWVVASFFFHDRGTSIQKSEHGFLQSILFQLLSQKKELFAFVYPMYYRCRGFSDPKDDLLVSTNSGWSLGLLQEALMAVCGKSLVPVNLCLFVDALDEHDGDHRELISVLLKLSNLTGNAYFRLRLVLAGRPENVFKNAFDSCPGFAIHKHTNPDIYYYVSERIRKELLIPLTATGEEELDELVTAIVQKAEGVFLWIKLVVDEIIEGLCEGDTVEETLSLLQTIPVQLSALYSRALRRPIRSSAPVGLRYKREAYVMFQLAITTRHPFGLYELLSATTFLTTEESHIPAVGLERLSIAQLERRLNSRSAGLLECTLTNRVQFIHQTVKDFILVGHGQQVIREGLDEKELQTGNMLLFRYTLQLLDCFLSTSYDVAAQQYVCQNFAFYARRLEISENLCVASTLEAKMRDLPRPLRYEILIQILDHVHANNKFYHGTTILQYMIEVSVLKYSLFYILCNLHTSLKKSLQAQSLTVRSRYVSYLLEALVTMSRGGHDIENLAAIILNEPGIQASPASIPLATRIKIDDLVTIIRAALAKVDKSEWSESDEIYEDEDDLEE